MARGYGTYSRLIAWLKVIFPLAALALLSTIFLVSSGGDRAGDFGILPEGSDATLQEGVEAPYFAGTTENGDVITMTAVRARPHSEGQLLAERIDASLRLSDGAVITLRSDQADLSDTTQEVSLLGDVEIESSTGYRVTTQQVSTSLERIDARSEGAIMGTGPVGSFSAGRMEITSTETDGSVQMLFTDGVKLIYDPKQQ